MFGGPPPPPSKAELEAQEAKAGQELQLAALTCAVLYLCAFRSFLVLGHVLTSAQRLSLLTTSASSSDLTSRITWPFDTHIRDWTRKKHATYKAVKIALQSRSM
ncbi:hypothetical protein EV356DRAFT_305612 [Viridothelium virens]|uniref:Uncharacterized protein n=1 Tax=Viridothelium virens TaxID=1048519 RepID=A0A6A6HJP5_VIRVR|nr:hypothetical protein EV356DRAFT_305612 [Viridothelium virens]